MKITVCQVTYIESFEPLGVHTLSIIDLVAVVVVVVIIVVVINYLCPSTSQVLHAHAEFSFYGVIAPWAVGRGLETRRNTQWSYNMR